MAEKMFDSIIVEREGHALPIVVQYEKYPLFCAHCRTLGHNIQNCSKMNVDNNGKAPKKATTMQHKARFISAMANKTVVEVFTNKVTPPKFTSVGKKHVNTSGHTYFNGVHNVSVHDFQEGKVDKSNTDYEILNAGNHELGIAQKNGENLTLHNNFELLESDTEQGTGEDIPNDKEYTPIILDRQLDKNPNVEEFSLGKEHLTRSTNIEDPSKLVKRASKPVDLSSSNPLLGTANGRLSFPITGPSSLDQSSNIGRLSLPNATSVSFGDAMDSIFDETTILQYIMSPITTNDEILGQDKRKVQITDGPKNK